MELSEIEIPARVYFFSISHYTFLVGSVKNCLMFITPTPEIPGQTAELGKEIPSVRQSTKNFSTIYAKMNSKKVKYNTKSGTSSKICI